MDIIKQLEVLKEELYKCRDCQLYKTRKQPVIGDGNPTTRIMLVGEAPGRYEDEQGKPFVGKAGKLLDEMLLEIGLSRQDLYITNVVKCRPPGNRVPTEDEIKACGRFLLREIEILKPKVIVALGATASRFIAENFGLEFKGAIKDCCKTNVDSSLLGSFKVVFCIHPAAALRR